MRLVFENLDSQFFFFFFAKDTSAGKRSGLQHSQKNYRGESLPEHMYNYTSSAASLLPKWLELVSIIMS